MTGRGDLRSPTRRQSRKIFHHRDTEIAEVRKEREEVWGVWKVWEAEPS
jgi:hypothetical protein